MAEYESQAARDAARMIGRAPYVTERYCESLDDAARRYRDLYTARGDIERADHVMTRTLGEALAGNNGD